MRHTQSHRSATRRGVAIVKVLLPLAAVIVLAIGGMIAFGGKHTPTAAAADVQAVSRATFEITVTANGELKSSKQQDLKSELDRQSSIVEVVDEGKFVKAGDVLARLNADEIQKDLDEAEDRLRSAENEVNVAENALGIQETDNASALSQAQTKIKLAQLELEKWLNGDDKEQKQANSLAIDKGEREEDRLKEKLLRSEELFQKDFLSKDELDQDRTAYIEAESNLKTYKLQSDTYENYTREKELTKLNSDVEEAVKDLDRVHKTNDSNLSTKKSQLDLAKANLRQVKTLVDKLRKQVDSTVIKAPTDGLVVYASSLDTGRWWGNNEGPIAVGREIHPNESIISLPDTSDMIASIKVHESLISKIHPGLPATVSIDAAQGRVFNATVLSTGIIAAGGNWNDPNLREYEVKLTLDLGEGDHGLKPSMRCEAKITLDKVENVVSVPLQSVFIDKAVNFVYIPDGSKFARTPVRIGRRSDLFAEVVEGVNEGAKVLMREPAVNLVKNTEFSDEVVAKFAAGPRRGPPGAASVAVPGGKPGGRSAAAEAILAKAASEAAAESDDDSETADDAGVDDAADSDEESSGVKDAATSAVPVPAKPESAAPEPAAGKVD